MEPLKRYPAGEVLADTQVCYAGQVDRLEGACRLAETFNEQMRDTLELQQAGMRELAQAIKRGHSAFEKARSRAITEILNSGATIHPSLMLVLNESVDFIKDIENGLEKIEKSLENRPGYMKPQGAPHGQQTH